jgi:hypothetical protein
MEWTALMAKILRKVLRKVLAAQDELVLNGLK